MKEKIVDKVSNKFNSIGKIKMQIIINKELFEEKTIDFNTYKSVENKLMEKLNKLNGVFSC